MDIKNEIISIFDEFKMPLHVSFLVKEAFANNWAKGIDSPREKIESCLQKNSEFSEFKEKEKRKTWTGKIFVCKGKTMYPWDADAAKKLQKLDSSKDTFDKLNIKIVKSVFTNKNEPLHYTEVATELYSKGYRPTSQFPDNIVKSYLLHNPNFKNVGRNRSGRFILLLKKRIKEKKDDFDIHSNLKFKEIKLEHEKYIKGMLYNEILGLKPLEFEKIVGILFSKMGFKEVIVTSASNDKGIDVRCTKVDEFSSVKYAIQVKLTKNKVGPSVVRDLRGSIFLDERGIIVTNNSLTSGATISSEVEKQSPIHCIDGKMLVDLLVKYRVGVCKPGELIEYKGLPDTVDVIPNSPITD